MAMEHWTDKANFYIQSFVNIQNDRIWAIKIYSNTNRHHNIVHCRAIVRSDGFRYRYLYRQLYTMRI